MKWSRGGMLGGGAGLVDAVATSVLAAQRRLRLSRATEAAERTAARPKTTDAREVDPPCNRARRPHETLRSIGCSPGGSSCTSHRAELTPPSASSASRTCQHDHTAHAASNFRACAQYAHKAACG
eukprot:6187109-Pleurochrysis_carterae.AAC.3